jgi:hypothetical protein
MFGWIDRAWQWATHNLGGDVVSWVRDLVHGIWSVLQTIFGNVADAWHVAWNAVNGLWRAAGKFASEVWGAFYHLYQIIIPAIVRWAKRELLSLSKFIDHVWSWAVKEVEKIYHWIAHEIATLIKWVMVHIWDPLFKSIELAWKWIFHEGKILWYYITHPDKLVALIFDSLVAELESQAWKVGGLLGKFFLALVVHNLRKFVLLLEDILMAVF